MVLHHSTNLEESKVFILVNLHSENRVARGLRKACEPHLSVEELGHGLLRRKKTDGTAVNAAARTYPRKQEVKEELQASPRSLQREYFRRRGVWLVLSSDCPLWALVLAPQPRRSWWTSPAERLLVSARPLRGGEGRAREEL